MLRSSPYRVSRSVGLQKPRSAPLPRTRAAGRGQRDSTASVHRRAALRRFLGTWLPERPGRSRRMTALSSAAIMVSSAIPRPAKRPGVGGLRGRGDAPWFVAARIFPRTRWSWSRAATTCAVLNRTCGRNAALDFRGAAIRILRMQRQGPLSQPDVACRVKLDAGERSSASRSRSVAPLRDSTSSFTTRGVPRRRRYNGAASAGGFMQDIFKARRSLSSAARATTTTLSMRSPPTR